MASDPDDVMAANSAFYAAFEAGSAGGMLALWEHSDDVSCTHPGWPTLHGWTDVRRSWEGILRHGGAMQFILTDERVLVRGDVAWVHCTENLLAVEGPRGTVAAINLFVRNSSGEWKVIHHHGAQVVATMLN
jgi:ketosteroid isomerase-like protein